MPFIRTTTNVGITPEKLEVIKSRYGEAIRIMNKSEDWLMLEFNDNSKMYFRGIDEPTVFIDVKVYGITSNSNEMTKELTNIISSELGIAPSSIYVAYQGYTDWGYNGNNL